MILYVANMLLPEMGMASANRVKSLGRGLCENGESVGIYIPFSDNGKKSEFKIGDIRCRAFFNSTRYRLLYALTWRFMFPLKLIFAIGSSKDITCVIGYSYSVQLLCSLWLIAKLFHLPYYREVSEYPVYIIHPSRFNWFGIRKFLEKHIVPKLFDGMITMTRHVREFYQPLARRKCRFLRLPMTVDCARFVDKGEAPYDFPYIAYCGSMSCDRRGMINLVDAFSVISEEYPDLQLILIGNIDAAGKLEMLKHVSSNAIKSKIIFTGTLPACEVPRYICNAKILALIRPSNKQAEGGFPTKLGEYLATGVPTVVTRVGEIDEFLTDRENIFFATPNSTESVASCFYEILQNYNRASNIGQKGKVVANTYFNYFSAGKSLSEFLSSSVNFNKFS